MRIGTAYRAYSFLFTHRVAEHRMDCKFHELTYNLHLLRPLGIEIDWLPPRLVPPRDALAEARKMLHDKGIAENKAIVLHPGSKGSSLKWGAEHFRRLGELIVRHGIPLLVTAGDDEESLAEYVAGERGIVICGLNLKTLAALYTLAVAVVAPNTGTLHLADAVGTRAFCVYPALRTMSPARWAPANFPGGAIVPQREICAKCSRSCGIYPCPDAVTPQQVFQKMAIFLEQIGG